MDVWDAIRDQRLDLANHLTELSNEQWDSSSLCAEWRIRDVLGHVTAGAQGAYGIGATLLGLARHRLSFNRWMAMDGRERGSRDPSITLLALREAAASRNAPPGAPKVSVLADVLIHAQDICRPLGIHREIPEDHLRPAADFVRSTFVFGAKKRIAGLRLKATDMDWSHGVGPEISGPAEALVMVMAGRTIALDNLTGDGKETLAARYS